MKKIVLSIAIAFSMKASAQIINTIAGSGAPYFTGDNVTAMNMQFGSPYSIVADASGNIFISDDNVHVIRKISPSGFVTTIAGIPGVAGYSGDGGLAIYAHLDQPNQLALDAAGNLYVDDNNNLVIRKISTSGIITTVAGNGSTSTSGDGGPATAAGISYTSGICVDAFGNLFISESEDAVIRKVDVNGIITTIAGNLSLGAGYSGDGGLATAATLNAPSFLSTDAAGDLFIADYNNNAIRMVNTTGIISTVAGNGTYDYTGDGGLATAATLAGPNAVKVDASGNLWIIDSENSVIRFVNSSGIISTITGIGTAGFNGDGGQQALAEMNYPTDIAINSNGIMFIADDGNHVIRKVDGAGIITSYAGTRRNYGGDGGPATFANLNGPIAVCTDHIGNYYFFESYNYVIRKVDVNGIISTLGGNNIQGNSGDGGLAINASMDYVNSMIVDGSGNLYFTDGTNNVVRKIDNAGMISAVAGTGVQGYSGDGGPATAAKLNFPAGLAIDSSGNLYIADAQNSVIRMINGTGIISTIAGNGTFGFSGDGGLATLAQFSGPQGIAFDSLGNLYISDVNNHVVRMIDSAGIITTIAGNNTQGYSGDGGLATAAQLDYVHYIAVDSIGNLFIAQGNESVIRKVDKLTGIITTIAGNGTSGFSGDGGLATLAQVSIYNSSIALDTAGNLLIADNYNNRIRSVCNVSIAPPTLTSSLTTVCEGHSTTLTASGASINSYSWSPVTTLNTPTGPAVIATPTTTITYTLTATQPSGCMSTAVQTITMIPTVATSQTVTLCAGQTMNVASIIHSSTGIYIDTIAAINTCDSIVTTDLTVNNPIDISTTTVSTTISSNANGATYQWINCNGNSPLVGETNQSFTATVAGNYAVVVTENSCSDTSACVTISDVSVGSIDALETIRLYPNPGSGAITLELNMNAKVIVTNAIGQLISEQQLAKGKSELNLVDQAAGVYFIRVMCEGIDHTIKFVKE